MPKGRPVARLTLSTEENNQLVEWTRRRKTAQALALRARIVLATSATGRSLGRLPSHPRPSANGVRASRRDASKDCWMSRARVSRARWAMPRSNA